MSQEQPPIRNRKELRKPRNKRLEVRRETGTAAPGAAGPASDVAAGGTPTRRQLKLMGAAGTAPAVAAPAPGSSDGGKRPAADPVAPGAGGQLPDGMTIEQALAARELLAQQAHNQLAKMEQIVATDPDAVDPEVLAEQIALAERITALNQRAAAKQEPAGRTSPPAPPQNDPASNDPAAVSNLAMVTPLEFEHIPGVEVPVMKRPATSHIPVVTRPGPPAEGSRTSGEHRPAPTRAELPVPPPVIDEADEAEEAFTGRNPVAAKSANGLDPLDAGTAGLSRARRLRWVQLGVTALGILALVAGITRIITNLAG